MFQKYVHILLYYTADILDSFHCRFIDLITRVFRLSGCTIPTISIDNRDSTVTGAFYSYAMFYYYYYYY